MPVWHRQRLCGHRKARPWAADPSPCSWGFCRSWRSRSSRPSGSRRSFAVNSKACSSSWSSSRGCPELESGTGHELIAWTLPFCPLSAQTQTKRMWRWMWRAWCSGLRLTCSRDSARARGLATHRAPVPGYDTHCPWHPFLFGLSLPGRSTTQAPRSA